MREWPSSFVIRRATLVRPEDDDDFLALRSALLDPARCGTNGEREKFLPLSGAYGERALACTSTTVFIKPPADAAVKKADANPAVELLNKVSRSIPGIGVIVSILERGPMFTRGI